MQIGDVIKLDDGSVGVISESLPRGYWRVQFPEGSHQAVLDGATLPAPSYGANDEVAVWPDYGIIKSVGADSAEVELSRQREFEGGGYTEWHPVVTVPLWRLTLDNDARLGRVW